MTGNFNPPNYRYSRGLRWRIVPHQKLNKMKNKRTNEQSLKNLIRENDTFLNAILVERLLLIINATEKELNENPQTFNTFFTNSKMYQQLVTNVKKHFPSVI